MRQSVCGIISVVSGIASLIFITNIYSFALLVLTFVFASIGLSDYLAYKWSSILGMVLGVMAYLMSFLAYDSRFDHSDIEADNSNQQAYVQQEPIVFEEQPLSVEEPQETIVKVNNSYELGDTWYVEDEWKLTILSVEETQDRNEFSDKNPEVVYIVTYEYENINFQDANDPTHGLYFDLNFNNRIVDCTGEMGYDYPIDVVDYPQELPIGTHCRAQEVCAFNHRGDFTIYLDKYDSYQNKQIATYYIDVD